MTVRLIAIKIWCQHSCSHQDGSVNPVARISVGIELFGWLVAFWQFFVVATRCAHALRLGFVKHHILVILSPQTRLRIIARSH